MFSEIPLKKENEYKIIYDSYAQGKEGNLSTSELSNILKSINIDASDEEIKDIIKKLELEDKKVINYEEFLSIINSKDKHIDEEEEVLNAFKVFDKDGNGLININELKELMLSIGNNWTEEEINEMLGEADIDMDGFIQYEEFVRTMMGK